MRKSTEEHETLTSYHHHSYATYYVQSPNSTLDTRTHDPGSEFQSPTRTDTTPLVLADKTVDLDDLPRSSAVMSSRYSHSSLYDYDYDYHHQKEVMMVKGVKNRLIIMDGGAGDHDEAEDEEKEEEWWSSGRSRRWQKYLSFRSSDSGWWIALQMGWRLVLSFGMALLVFCLATQPPHPKFTIQIGRVREFTLGEGADPHGVTTKILTCNCSIKLIVDNKSKVFGLHIHPPSMDISFSHIVIATSQGPKMYAENHNSTTFHLQIGTKNKPMYGAGREMADMLRSRRGLLLTLRMSLVSDYRVVWNIIKPMFRHQAECFLFLAYDQIHRQIIIKDKHCRLVT